MMLLQSYLNYNTYEWMPVVIFVFIVLLGLAYVLIVPICVAIIASEQGRSGFGWFLFSFLANPVFSILILIALGDTEEKHREKVINDEKARLSVHEDKER